MKAAEARQTALKTILNNEYPIIIGEISNAAEKGQLECYIYINISQETRKRLMEDGYNVGKTSFNTNEYLTRIEW